MSTSNSLVFICGSERKIEDVVNLRKAQGHYDICCISRANSLRRYPLSMPDNTPSNFDDPSSRETLFEDGQVWRSEGDIRSLPNIWSTDSEITIVRVKRQTWKYKSLYNNWLNFHDRAVPGDGTHLGESPSLVNLVTLVPQAKTTFTNELMIPLSSWDPEDNPHEIIVLNNINPFPIFKEKKDKAPGQSLTSKVPCDNEITVIKPASSHIGRRLAKLLNIKKKQ